MLVAIVALVVAASGTAVAATKLVKGDSLIKKNSLSGNRLRNRSVNGSKIKVSSLGTVPKAKHASTADRATNATNAVDASTLGGQFPSAFDTASNWTRSGLVPALSGQEISVATFGPFTLTLKCINAGASGIEAQILVSSTAAGSTAFGTALPTTTPFLDNGPATTYQESSGSATFVSPNAVYQGEIMDAVNSPASVNPCVAAALISKS